MYFQGGTLILRSLQETQHVPRQFQFIREAWRCEAYHYGKILPWVQEQEIRNSVPRWTALKLTLYDQRDPHDYQESALKAWEAAKKRGSIVLPTGAGKTFVAIQAIHRTKAATVVFVPTLNLLYQWYVVLTNAFQTNVGVYYHSEKRVEPITVTTYHSAGDLIAEYGNQFKLLICDEVHHLPAKTWGEAALMAPAPLRLGLTATYPEEHEQVGERWNLTELIGPIVHTQHIESLVGRQLAQYRTQRIRVNLTQHERERYDKLYTIYTGFIQQRRLRSSHGPGWLRELMRLSAFDAQARQALLARHRLLKIIAECEEKFAVLETLLRQYAEERILIFTEANDVAYRIAQQYFVPIISHETTIAERKHILEAFQSGTYRVIVTSKVLNEGVDVPEAKVAIVLGGGASKREYIQRLGRILRKQELREAALFEILVRKTIEESKVQRRHVRREER